MKFIEIIDIDKNTWNDFVLSHQNGNFFQTCDYYELHNKSSVSNSIGYAVIQDNEVLGVIVGVIYKNYLWPVNTLTKRTVIIGGPLIKDNRSDVFDFLMNEFCKAESKNSIYIQFRNTWDIKNQNFTFEKFNFVYEDHLDILHDLTQSKESIIQNISKGKIGNIHKSKNKGTLIEEIKIIEDFKSGLNLITSTYKRIGLPCPPKEYFINAFTKHKDSGLIKSFGVFVDNEIIAMRIEICYKDKIYDWYTGDKEGFNNRYPNDVLPFHIILWGKENGYKTFDFGGAGKPNIPYGVRDHKIKFGGELVSYGRYEKVNSKLKMFFLKVGFYIFKISKRNMKYG